MKEKQCILLFGNVLDGIAVIYGPFDDKEAAEAYGDQVLLTMDYKIAFLVEPE